jgi:AtzE family amidohydrolase
VNDSATGARAIADAVRAGSRRARDVVDSALQRVETLDPAVNSFTDVLAERARAEADRLDAAVTAGRDPGPLAGVPFAVKNLFDVAGIRTLAGSKIYRERPIASRDAAAVRALSRAGAVLVGALNMDEYAYGFTTENTHYGPARNPHDLARVAGGSSGGSGAALAAGLVPLTLGTDTNGSIRVPASLCGVFGLKPTYGRVSRVGAVLFAGSFDHVGPLARSVEDLAVAFDALQGPDPDDPVCSERPASPVGRALGRGVDGLRIAVAEDYFAQGAEPEALDAVAAMARALGVTRGVTFPEPHRARAAAMVITAAEGAQQHLELLRTRAADFDPLVRPDGTYTLRLVVTDSSGLSSEDRTFLQVKNVEVTTPLGNDSHRRGATIDVRGSVPGGTQFDHYTIEYGAGYNPTEWHTAGITLANGGTLPVIQGSLGKWDTTGLAGPGIYTLRVAVTSTWGVSVATVEAIYLDPRLKVGWPVRLPYDFVPEGASAQPHTSAAVYTFAAPPGSTQTSTTVATSSPVFAELAGAYYWGGLLATVATDLDRNGGGEVIVVQGGSPPKLRVFGRNGQQLWLAPLGTAAVTGGNIGMPAVADIDNDGLEEIIACMPDFSTYDSLRLFAFHSDGTNVVGFPVTIAMDFQPTVAIADVDNDGFKDIVVQGNGGTPRKMTIVGRLGNVMSQWTLPVQRSGAAIVSTPAIGNFDADPQLEIVVAEPSEFAGRDNNTGVVHVFNIDGTQVPGWPKYTQGITFSSPVVADSFSRGHSNGICAMRASIAFSRGRTKCYAFSWASTASRIRRVSSRSWPARFASRCRTGCSSLNTRRSVSRVRSVPPTNSTQRCIRGSNRMPDSSKSTYRNWGSSRNA